MKYVLMIILFYSSCINAQNDTEHNAIEITYDYEPILTNEDFNSFESNLLNSAKTKKDSAEIYAHVNMLRDIQKTKLINDTSQYCEIYFLGPPQEFQYSVNGKNMKFQKSDFVKKTVSSDYEKFVSSCLIQREKRANKIIDAVIKAEEFDIKCDLDISFNRINISLIMGTTLIDSIRLEHQNDSNLPIPVLVLDNIDDKILLQHIWSN